MHHKSKYYNEIDDGLFDLSMQNLKVFPTADLLPLADRNYLTSLPAKIVSSTKLSELDLSENSLCKFCFLAHLERNGIKNGNGIKNLPEDFFERKVYFHLVLPDNTLSSHLLDANGNCQNRRECELAAARVMKYQAVYQQKCIKVRKQAEAKKRKEENRAKRAARKSEWTKENLELRRKLLETDQLIEKLEAEHPWLKEAEAIDDEQESAARKKFIIALLIAILAVYFKFVQV